MSGHLLWSVFVDTADERLWRETLGQASLDAWCAAHGWDSKDIASGSVNVYAYRDGRVEVAAEVPVRDKQGKPLVDGTKIRTRTVTARLVQSLPEGIGTVIR